MCTDQGFATDADSGHNNCTPLTSLNGSLWNGTFSRAVFFKPNLYINTLMGIVNWEDNWISIQTERKLL